MTTPVTYDLREGVATISLDDGRANALSLDVQAALRGALERSVEDRAVVLMRGNAKLFSAGFDLATLREGGERAVTMVRGGFELAASLLGHPTPTVIECTGHAVAMGALLLLAADIRIGSTSTYKIATNEVSIGLTMPRCAIALMRQRLTPSAVSAATALGAVFDPPSAVAAGFLDRLVPAEELHSQALVAAQGLHDLPLAAHAETKLRLRRATIDAMAAALAMDAEDFRAPFAG